MKVLFYRYGSICEPGMISALQNLKADVIEITEEITNKSISPKESMALLQKHLDRGGFSCVFTVNFFPWLAQIANIYRILYISVIVDSPVMELYSNSIKLPFNRIFLFDRCLYNEFYAENPENIFHLPLAANTELYNRVIRSANEKTKARYRQDISFIGSLYTEKCVYNRLNNMPDYERGFADGLIAAQLNVYGYNFMEDVIDDAFVDTVLSCDKAHFVFPEKSRPAYKSLVAQEYLSVKVGEQERIKALSMLSEAFQVDIYTGSDTQMMPKIHNRGFAKTHTEMPLIFNQSKINLNITAKSIRSGLSLRIFDVLACGGFLITNYQEELPELFDIGTDLECYSSLDELKEKCAYYLAHDRKRENIAKNGYEKVSRLHGWNTRILQILDAASGT